jgi:hypothetical protein
MAAEDLTSSVTKALEGLKDPQGNVKKESKETHELITSLVEEIKRLEVKKSQETPTQENTVDLTDSSAIQKWMNSAPRVSMSFEDKRKALSDEIRKQIKNDTISTSRLRSATVQEEIFYYRASGNDTRDSRIDSRTLQIGPIFKEGTYQEWRAFEYNFLEAIKNRNVQEADLKHAFHQRLQGEAHRFFFAIPKVLSVPFGEILQIFRERYNVGKLKTRNDLLGAAQKPKEKIVDYLARLKIMAYAMLPVEPEELKAFVTDGYTYVIPNPMYSEDDMGYNQQLKAVQNELSGPFYRGLLPEIKNRMNSQIYDDLGIVQIEAEKAEWILSQESPPKIHNLEVLDEPEDEADDEDEEVNALVKGKRRVPAREWSRKTKPGVKGYQAKEKKKFTPDEGREEKGACFRCKQYGHWIANCPVRVVQNRFQNWERRRFGSRPPARQNAFKSTNPRGTRKWMVQKRAALNKKGRNRRVHNLETDEYSDEEMELCHMEAELAEEDFQNYAEEVELEEAKNEEG